MISRDGSKINVSTLIHHNNGGYHTYCCHKAHHGYKPLNKSYKQ